MIQLMRLLSFLVNIYMMIIFVRIILTWFSWERGGGLTGILARITDPYLNWFRRFPFLRTAIIDFSPIAALGILSMANRIFSILAAYGTISIGIILALLLQALWSIISFLTGFLIIILILRLIAHFAALNSANPFWRIVEGISQPVLFRINRILFRNRIATFRTGLIVSIACLVIIYFLLRTLVAFGSGLLIKLPF